MTFEPFVIWIFIGVIAGWLASGLAKDHGYGLFGRMGVGALGAFFGASLFHTSGLAEGGGPLGEMVGAVSGAVGTLFLVRFFRTRRDHA
jgi:uncharacterized membrane protein YeaQ/YmgE (transglycosylase-associated protein family)